MHREGKQGLGTAYLAGFRYAMEHDYAARLRDGRRLQPRAVGPAAPGLRVGRDAELVIGSRYVKGGCTVGWGFRRRTAVARRQPLRARDAVVRRTRQHRGLPLLPHRGATRRLDLDAVHAQGYAFQIEMAYPDEAASGFEVREVPIHFVDRRVGQSKMDGAIAREALVLVPQLRLRVRRSLSKSG